jgi:hypothetical protein
LRIDLAEILPSRIDLHQSASSKSLSRLAMGMRIVPIARADLIRIKDPLDPMLHAAPSQNGGVVMPINAIILSAVILTMFVAFGAVLMWADFQTRPHRLKTDVAKPRRRAL